MGSQSVEKCPKISQYQKLACSSKAQQWLEEENWWAHGQEMGWRDKGRKRRTRRRPSHPPAIHSKIQFFCRNIFFSSNIAFQFLQEMWIVQINDNHCMDKNLEATCQCDFMVLTEIKGSGWGANSQLHYTPTLTSHNGTWWIHKGNMLFWRLNISINNVLMIFSVRPWTAYN